MTALAIMTDDGWKTIGDFQTIQPKEVAGEKLIRDNVFCGWSPLPMGTMSNRNAQDFSEKIRMAGSLVDDGCPMHDALEFADHSIINRRIVERATRSAVA